MLGFVARGARWRRAIAAALVSGTFIVTALPGAALAGGATNFFVPLGGECLDGGTNPDRTFEVTVKDPNGKIKSRQFIQSNEFGDWGMCFNGRVDTGDTIRTNGTGADRTFTVPSLTILTNRATNEVWGTAPANSSVELFLDTCKTFAEGSCSEKVKNVPTAADGSYLTTFNGPNPRGGDFITAAWFDHGDIVSRGGNFESVSVALGGFERGWFRGTTNEGTTLNLDLRAGSVLRGSGSATANQFGSYEGRFRSSGAPVYPTNGDRVTGNLASDLNLAIPAVNLQSNTGNDHVTGRCFANQAFQVEAFREGPQGDFSVRQGKAGSNGSFNVDMSAGDFSGFNLRSGDTILLRCRNAQGDEITHEKQAGSPLSAPTSLSGDGDDFSYPVRFGYDGPFNASPRGLIPATTSNGSVEQDGTAVFEFNIPSGKTLARFALFNEETDGFHDLDLFVFRDDEPVGQSFRGDSNEVVDIVNPAPGTYRVEVAGFFIDGPEANFTLFSWVLGSGNAGNMSVSEPSTASSGDTGTIHLSFSGLAPDTRYLGSVTYSGTSGMPDPTIVEIHTP